MDEPQYRKIKVLVETAERSFKGFIFKPEDDEDTQLRLSDYLNHYDDKFLRLAEVEITERGQHYRIGEKQEFVAVAVNAITYIAPMDGE